MSDLIDFTALWQVVAIALVAGVGVVSVFSLGLVTISAPSQGGSVGPVRRALGGLCFAACAAVVLFAVWLMFTSK